MKCVYPTQRGRERRARRRVVVHASKEGTGVWGGEGSKGVRGVEVWDEKHAVVLDRVMGAIFGWEWGGEAWVWAND